VEALRTFYFNEVSRIRYFWTRREKFLPAKHATCLLMQLRQPGFKRGFNVGHAPAVVCPGLRQAMYLAVVEAIKGLNISAFGINLPAEQNLRSRLDKLGQ